MIHIIIINSNIHYTNKNKLIADLAYYSKKNSRIIKTNKFGILILDKTYF